MAPEEQPLHKNNFFVETFSHRESGMSLAALLRPDLSAQLDWSSLQILPTSFIDPSLAATQADMLYTVRLRDKPESAYVYVLLEHQSSQPKRILNRMHGYITRIEEHHFKKHPDTDATPIILPLILYQGKTDWHGTPQYIDTYRLGASDKLLFGPYIPDFTCEIISLPSLQIELLALDPYLEAALRLMQSVRNGTIMRCLKAIEAPLIRIYRDRDDRHFVVACYTYAHYADDVDINRLRDTLDNIQQPELRHAAMNAAEQIHHAAMNAAEEVIQRIRQDNILEALELRFSCVPDGLVDLIRSIQDSTKLHQLFRSAMRAESLDRFAAEI